MRGQITYQYAYGSTGEMTDILKVNLSDRRGPWHCIACGSRMYACLKDDIKARHFRHASHQPCAAPESYYHIVAKNLFLITFRACRRDNLPYIVERKVQKICTEGHEESVCAYGEQIRYTDLARIYDEVEMEKGLHGYVADCLLTSTSGQKQPLLVEFKVTSAVSRAKAEEVGQIIEIRLPLENAESVLDAIRNAYLPEDAIKWYGCGKQVEMTGECRKRPPVVYVAPYARPVNISPGARFPEDPRYKAVRALSGTWRGDPSRFAILPDWSQGGLIAFWDRETREYICWDGETVIARKKVWREVLEISEARKLSLPPQRRESSGSQQITLPGIDEDYGWQYP